MSTPTKDDGGQRYFTRNRLTRGQGLRKTTGCLTCRRRHVKCDEGKPACANCERVRRECSYAPSRSAAPTISPSAESSTAVEETPAPPAEEPGPLVAGEEPNGRGLAQDPIVQALATIWPPPAQLDTPQDWAPTAQLNVDSATTLWAELLLQDAALPESGFLDTDIFGSGSEVVADGAPWQSSTTLELAPDEHKLFQNFVHNLSRWMDFFDPLRPFGTLVPRLALRNVGLLNAILALSVRHLSLNRRFQRVDEAAQSPVDALPYYFKTLHYIQEAMQHDSYKGSRELLATASIVSAYEMLDGSRQDWERHLKGLFCIQRSQTIHGDSGGLKGAVWWAWLCQDVWAAFREGRKPFTFWRPDRVLGLLAPHELAARSVHLFAQAVAFCSKEEVVGGHAAPLARIAQADSLRARLEDWRAHLGVEFEPIPQDTVPKGAFEPIWIHPPEHAIAVQMYYCSHILLLLHRPALGGLDVYNSQRRELADCTNKICGIAMTMVDDPSSVMCSQALYIAGMTLEGADRRQLVVDLLEQCWQRAGWPLTSLGEELKLRWG